MREYFVVPLYSDTFNPANTLVYAALFMVLISIMLRIFERFRIAFDREFYFYLLFYIILGALMGALKDLNYLASPLFSTVGIYVLILLLLLGTVVAGKLVEGTTGLPYSIVPVAAAIVGIIFLAAMPKWMTPVPLLSVLALGVFSAMAVVFLAGKLGLRVFETRVNQGALLAQMLDASSTYVGVTLYGFREKFFLTDYMMQAFTPASVFVLKGAAVLAVLYLLDKSEDGTLKDAVKAAIVTLGLAPAARNTFLSMFY